MNVTIKANKKFILSNNDGVIEYKTTIVKKGYIRSIYFITLEGLKYKVNPKTFSSITSNLERFSTKKNGFEIDCDTTPFCNDNDVISVFYKVNI